MSSRDPYKYFRIEARELLEGLQRGIVELGAEGGELRQVLPPLLRQAHTLKGAARVVRLTDLSDLAHRLEDLLAACRDSGAPPAPDARAEMQRLIAAIAANLAKVAPSSPEGGETPTAAAEAAPTVLAETVRLQLAEVDAVLSGVADTSAELAAMRADFRGFDRACQQARLIPALASRRPAAAVERENAARLQSEAVELAAGLDGLRQRLDSRMERIGQEVRRLHEDASRLRLISAEALWAHLERTLRDASQTLGRRVRLETISRTPRFDTPVFAVLQEALQHLVRNAIVHGIEPEPGRRAAGKPVEGRILVRIDHGPGRLVVRCEDDGCGIDPKAVGEAAAAKGWLAAGSATPPTMDEAIRLLLRGGLTTTDTPTQMSGRGVGLDTVRAAVARIHGEMAIRSTPGRGTVVTLDLPVALSALETLVVETGGVKMLLPLEAVRFVARSSPAEIRRSGKSEELCVGNEVMTYAALHRLLPAFADTLRPPRGPLNVVVIGDGTARAAIGVDRLLGATETVIRPLPALADAVPFVAGASLDASGAPLLLFEARALIMAIRNIGTEPAPTSTVMRPPILVVDDSLTTRMLEQSILESAGYAVDLADSGEDALRRLRERRYGLLLVDIEMPGMDGLALLEQVRREPAWRAIPAILVTSRESREDRQRGLSAGAQDYVVKGEFDQRRLLQRIGELLS